VGKSACKSFIFDKYINFNERLSSVPRAKLRVSAAAVDGLVTIAAISNNAVKLTLIAAVIASNSEYENTF